MAVVVSLREMVEEMQLVSSESHAYMNKVSGEFVTIFDEYIAAMDGDEDWSDRHDWEQEIFDQTKEVLSSDDYLGLPSQFELHEYDIMESFCLSIPDEKLSDLLLNQIRGSGAFRRFKDTIYRYGIEKDWFRFRADAYKEIAIDWLENNDLAYTDDMNKGVQSS
jgi:hypothetical protein